MKITYHCLVYAPLLFFQDKDRIYQVYPDIAEKS